MTETRRLEQNEVIVHEKGTERRGRDCCDGMLTVSVNMQVQMVSKGRQSRRRFHVRRMRGGVRGQRINDTSTDNYKCMGRSIHPTTIHQSN